MTIHFVLVKPAVPENIGAAARAIKTMGFDRLRIVASDQHLNKKARILAHGAKDILDNVLCFDDLTAAVADMDWVIGTSAKRRLGKRFSYTAAELPALIESKANAVQNIALVMGCEESGLTNEQLACCDALSSIPIAQSYPSLNLSQAVMIYAYSLQGLAMIKPNDPIDEQSWRVLKTKTANLMAGLDISTNSRVYGWAMERLSALTRKDIDFLHLLIDKIDKKMRNGMR